MLCAFVASVYKHVTFISPSAIYVRKLKMLLPLNQFNAQKFYISCCATGICVAASRYRKKMCDFICHILKEQLIIHVGLMVIF